MLYSKRPGRNGYLDQSAYCLPPFQRHKAAGNGVCKCQEAWPLLVLKLVTQGVFLVNQNELPHCPTPQVIQLPCMQCEQRQGLLFCSLLQGTRACRSDLYICSF